MKPVEFKDGAVVLVAQGQIASVTTGPDGGRLVLLDAEGVKRTIDLRVGAPAIWVEAYQFVGQTIGHTETTR